MIKKEYITPVRIMKASDNVTNAQSLLIPSYRQSVLGAPQKAPTEITGKGYIVLDFGKEYKGGLLIVCRNAATGDENGAEVRIRFGESVNEAMAELGEKGACNDHAPRDFSISLVHWSAVKWGDSGFRFARLDFKENSYVSLDGIYLESETLDLPVKYEYQGNDPVIQEIYTAAKRTIDLCSSGEYVWDGIKRDRLVWIGDIYPEMLALCTLYGRTDIVDNSINLMRETTPIGNWMCGHASYSAWWLIVLADYYQLTGCDDLVTENLEYACKTVTHFLNQIDENGDLGELRNSLVDWPTREQPDEPAGVRAILAIMANRAVSLFQEFHQKTDDAIELLNRLTKQPITVTHALQVIGLKYFAVGQLSESDITLLEKQGAHGMSTFMSYFILTAYANHFGVNKAVDIMKEYYGGMLSVGSTTFWEDFHLEWLENSGRIDEFTTENQKDIHGDFGDFCYKGFRHSLCHAWSTGILAFMKENNL